MVGIRRHRSGGWQRRPWRDRGAILVSVAQYNLLDEICSLEQAVGKSRQGRVGSSG